MKCFENKLYNSKYLIQFSTVFLFVWVTVELHPLHLELEESKSC